MRLQLSAFNEMAITLQLPVHPFTANAVCPSVDMTESCSQHIVPGSRIGHSPLAAQLASRYRPRFDLWALYPPRSPFRQDHLQ